MVGGAGAGWGVDNLLTGTLTGVGGTKTCGAGVPEPGLLREVVLLIKFTMGLVPVMWSRDSTLSESQMMLGSTFSPAEHRESKLDQTRGFRDRAFLSRSVATIISNVMC